LKFPTHTATVNAPVVPTAHRIAPVERARHGGRDGEHATRLDRAIERTRDRPVEGNGDRSGGRRVARRRHAEHPEVGVRIGQQADAGGEHQAKDQRL
jgi:hypothetical protein